MVLQFLSFLQLFLEQAQLPVFLPFSLLLLLLVEPVFILLSVLLFYEKINL